MADIKDVIREGVASNMRGLFQPTDPESKAISKATIALVEETPKTAALERVDRQVELVNTIAEAMNRHEGKPKVAETLNKILAALGSQAERDLGSSK